jgi:hypothetical protein
MKKSPEATKIISSYKKNQYLFAIDHITHLGRMNAELAKTMHAREEAERLRLEALAREDVLLLKIEALKREREEYEKNANNKILELQTNIEQQKKSQEEMKRRFVEEKDSIIKSVYRSFDEFPKNEEIKKLDGIKTKKKKVCCMCVIV